MKRLSLIVIALFSFSLMPNSLQAARYVCYDSRSTSRDAYGNNWVKYRGCYLSRSSCGYNGSNHFGRYPNDYQARRALYRCRTNTPRFVD